jgi:hypothetical protein
LAAPDSITYYCEAIKPRNLCEKESRSMAKVISFPTESAWRVTETNLRSLARDGHGSEAMVAWILKDLRPRFDACTRLTADIKIPKEAVPAFAEMSTFFREAMTTVIWQLLYIEIELWTAKFGDG